MGEHEESCGSRTDECENCKRRIMLKDLEDHIASGCKTPPRENGKREQGPDKIKKPERLIGGQPTTAVYGFPFHPQFQPNPYPNEGTVNPYFPRTKTYDLLNNDSSQLERPVPTAMPVKPPPTTGQHLMPQDWNPGQSSFNRKSRGPFYREANVSDGMDPGDEKRIGFSKRSTYGARNSNSDSDDMEATFDGDEVVDTSGRP